MSWFGRHPGEFLMDTESGDYELFYGGSGEEDLSASDKELDIYGDLAQYYDDGTLPKMTGSAEERLEKTKSREAALDLHRQKEFELDKLQEQIDDQIIDNAVRATQELAAVSSTGTSEGTVAGTSLAQAMEINRAIGLQEVQESRQRSDKIAELYSKSIQSTLRGGEVQADFQRKMREMREAEMKRKEKGGFLQLLATGTAFVAGTLASGGNVAIGAQAAGVTHQVVGGFTK